jgi:hypothetical protein
MGVQLIGAWPDILLPKDILPNGHFPWRRKKHLSVPFRNAIFRGIIATEDVVSLSF